MNKSELIEITAKEADISKAAAEKALAAVMAAIVKAVAKGDSVTLVGFGSFKSSKRAARVGRNPQTGKELKIAATTVPRFTAGATFKAAVAGKKAAKKKYLPALQLLPGSPFAGLFFMSAPKVRTVSTLSQAAIHLAYPAAIYRLA